MRADKRATLGPELADERAREDAACAAPAGKSRLLLEVLQDGMVRLVVGDEHLGAAREGRRVAL